ncbi:MAG TPA: hypothetical protein VJM69_06770 [Dehalococcoidia bacterium]|nr:hypothetical protein [Dehalococcoidia bacterium]
MKALLAGFLTGYMVAICWTIWAGVLLARYSQTILWLRRAVPPQVSAVALMVPLFLLLPLLLTALGLVLGGVYWATQAEAPGALGTPHWPFTLLVTAPPLFLAALISLRHPRLLRPVWGFALPFALIFGWVMPFLASR